VTDYIGRLAERALGRIETVRPRLPHLFEPVSTQPSPEVGARLAPPEWPSIEGARSQQEAPEPTPVAVRAAVPPPPGMRPAGRPPVFAAPSTDRIPGAPASNATAERNRDQGPLAQPGGQQHPLRTPGTQQVASTPAPPRIAQPSRAERTIGAVSPRPEHEPTGVSAHSLPGPRQAEPPPPAPPPAGRAGQRGQTFRQPAPGREPAAQSALNPVPPGSGDQSDSPKRPVSPRASPQPAVRTVAPPALPPFPQPAQEWGPPATFSRTSPAAAHPVPAADPRRIAGVPIVRGPEARPTISVSIGRIEVRAAAQSPAPGPRPQIPPDPAPSLDEYLKSRSGVRQ
jgi:hypothetical protein